MSNDVSMASNTDDKSASLSCQPDEKLLKGQLMNKKRGYNVAHWHMDRSHQKVFHKPNNLFAQQHHEAKALFCKSVPIDTPFHPERLRKITALEISDDCNYFVIAGVRGG